MQQSILEEIRNYTFQNKELLNSHHFLFGCPIQKNMKSTDVIILGKNPGGDPKKDFRKTLFNEPFPTEESSDYDFIESDLGKKRIRHDWSIKMLKITGLSNLLFSECFFWNSKNEGKAFQDRFGYSFLNNPHLDFCTKKNIELFDLHHPKLILVTSSAKEFVDVVAKKYKLIFESLLKLTPNSRGQSTFIHHYNWNNIPFIFIPHPNYQAIEAARLQIKDYIKSTLQEGMKKF